MNRVMIIGCCGSGKSTLSISLAKASGLPLYHLDQYYWKPNWTETEDEEWTRIVQSLADKPRWIIDGNYGGTMDIRIAKADAIVYLDVGTFTCLWRVLKRIWKYHGKVRPDMPEGCKERFDLGFLHYVAVFNLMRRKRLLSKLESVKTEKSVFILRNNREFNTLIESFKKAQD